MMVIGDSVLSMTSPRRHVSLWYGGPTWWRRMCEPFLKYPNITRALGAAGVAAGIWLARKQEPRTLPTLQKPRKRLRSTSRVPVNSR